MFLDKVEAKEIRWHSFRFVACVVGRPRRESYRGCGHTLTLQAQICQPGVGGKLNKTYSMDSAVVVVQKWIPSRTIQGSKKWYQQWKNAIGMHTVWFKGNWLSTTRLLPHCSKPVANWIWDFFYTFYTRLTTRCSFSMNIRDMVTKLKHLKAVIMV